MPNFAIRPFRSLEDFRACVRLQEEVWGAGFSERVPVAILMGSQRIGGVCAGAFAPGDERLLGFVFGMTGVEGGELAHWSDMLAVRPELRESGLGLALKAYQRDTLLERKIRTVRWTFDPLMAKNAYLNIRKLGATAHEYIPEMYGNTGSPLHRGIGTDRLVAVWKLDSERVSARIDSRSDAGTGAGPVCGGVGYSNQNGSSGTGAGDPESVPTTIAVEMKDGHPCPGPPSLALEDLRLLVPIPADIQSLKRTEPEVAKAWRAATRSALVHYLGRGYVIDDFLRGTTHSHYHLVRATSSESSEDR